MMSSRIDAWDEVNQRRLSHSLENLRLRLELFLEQSQDAPETEETDLEARVEEEVPQRHILDHEGDEPEEPEPFHTLGRAFGLTAFEKAILLLCAGVELDARVAGLVTKLQRHSQRTLPTFGFALAVLEDPHWSALTPAGPLRQWRMIELGSGDTLTERSLHIDERVLHYLKGLSYLDQRFHGYIEPVTQVTELPPAHQPLVGQIVSYWGSPTATGRGVIQLTKGDEHTTRAIAAEACAQLGINLHVLRAGDIPTNGVERVALARLWEREAVLGHTALLVEQGEAQDFQSTRSFLAHTRSLIFLSVKEPLSGFPRKSLRVEIPRLTHAEQLAFWHRGLGESAASLNGHLERMVAQFEVGPTVIQEVCAEMLAHHQVGEERSLNDRLWHSCRIQARQRLDELAERIDAKATWDDLIVPPAQLRTLRDIAGQVRNRMKVHEEWGFSRISSRGLGISALFTGPSGVGKTMASEVLANELALDLYKIDLSQVVSKYIGETEKNLRRVFDAAEQSGAILLFDEADALFGKRTEVKDSHDRYANIECSYLLQRMENYRGLAILTTNMKQGLDQAFLRRIRFIVPFPFPSAEQRMEMWRRVFPKQTPTKDVDLKKLSRLTVTGGNIKNIAMHAAFFAAERNEPVGMAHLLQATRAEYAKLEHALPEKDIRNWVDNVAAADL